MTFRVGWEEWVALPELRIPAVRAKVDTGAQTSALHAFSIHPFEREGKSHVRFGLHPLPERPDIELHCEAECIGQREITSSNGETELRFIIRTMLAVGARRWPVEISLTNRETMSYRMLLGRRALEEGALVDVTTALVHGAADLTVYDALPHVRAARTSLSIALLCRDPESLSVERLREAASARGHRVTLLDCASCHALIGREGFSLHADGAPLPRADAVLPWFGRDRLSLALLRHFEALGSRSLNGSAALLIAADRLHLLQRLAGRGLPLPRSGFVDRATAAAALVKAVGKAPFSFHLLGAGGPVRAASHKTVEALLALAGDSPSPLLIQRQPAQNGFEHLRCLVIARRVVAVIRIESGKPGKAKVPSNVRKLAGRAVAALGLKVAAVDILLTADGPLCLDVDPAFDLAPFEALTGVDAAAAIIGCLESRLLPATRR